MKKVILVLSLILTSLLSCSEPDDNPYEDSVCNQMTTVDNEKYKSTQSVGFSIENVRIIGDCLEVKIASTGCSGDTWKVDLVDAGRVSETAIEQRDLKMLLHNEELCEALFQKTFTFDLRPIRTTKKVVLLNLELWEDQIRYEY